MLSYNRSVIPIIESAYEELTNVEKNIANYFIDQVEDEDLSSKAVSQRLYVSEASLSRFAKKLGFSGYRQFLFAYQDSHQSSRHLDLLTKKVLNSYQKVLEKTYSLIDNEYRSYYDELILIGGLKNLAISDKISPQVPALIVVDILYSHYLNYNNDNKKEKLQMTLEHINYELEE